MVTRFLGPPRPRLGGSLPASISGKFNEIQVGRINRFVQKLLGIKGGPPVPSVASDLFFIHTLFSGYETHYLEGWDRFFTAQTFTAAAANAQVAELRNPPGSNVMVVLERANISSAGSGVAEFGAISQNTTNADNPTAFTARNMDHRGRGNSGAIQTFNTGGANTISGPTYIKVPMPVANTFVDLLRRGDEITILPGDAVFVFNAAAQVQVVIGMVWRERFLEDSERF